MTARVLVVDDVAANVKLLETWLTAEYFDVVTAMNGPEALEICARSQCDIVLLDVLMPGMDGFEVCRRLKADPACHHIPVIMVTALDQPSDRVRGIEAGADDFLTKPVGDVALYARVRSLARLKMLTDELQLRARTTRELGVGDALVAAMADDGRGGRILVVEDRKKSADALVRALEHEHEVAIESDPHAALFRLAEPEFDLAIVSLGLADFDALRLCSQLRSLDRTRSVPILLLAEQTDTARVIRGLDIGVNDYLLRPLDKNELVARVRTQIRRKRYTETLRDNVQQSMELAVTDGLTGLHNRRYLQMHLKMLLDQAGRRGDSLSLLLVDIDHFKVINDTWGHDAGDDVLRAFARKLRMSTRGIDLACRYGGEEFVIVMPDTSLAVASTVAERLREQIAAEPFEAGEEKRHVGVTISVGVAAAEETRETPERLLKRADEALYVAKRAGRNRIALAAA
jgi:two-component system cell cycle response regulator